MHVEDTVYDSPLHYCASCKQYIELDQTAEECALKHGCKADCPFARLLKPPTSVEDKTGVRPAPAKAG